MQCTVYIFVSLILSMPGLLCFKDLDLDILTNLPIVELLTFKPCRNGPWSIFLLHWDHLFIFECEHVRDTFSRTEVYDKPINGK